MSTVDVRGWTHFFLVSALVVSRIIVCAAQVQSTVRAPSFFALRIVLAVLDVAGSSADPRHSGVLVFEGSGVVR